MSAYHVEKQDSLPFPPTPMAGTASLTMQESVYEPRVTPRRLPEDAPNILIVLMDDAGPGQPSTFGGEINTPTLDRILGEGIGYNRFHTTALCSPTRASLLTGRNHHKVCTGVITEFANDWDAFSGRIPKSSALVAEVLKDYGYATAGVGQVAQHAGHRGRPDRPVRVLADQLGVRVLLRVPGRGVVAVRAEPGPQHDVRAAGEDPGRGLPPERGPGRRRHRLAAQAQGHGPGPALLHVLGQRRDPRPPPRAQGVHRQVPGQVRRRLGRLPRARVRAGQGEGLDPSRDATDRRGTSRWRPGTASPRASGRSRAG